MVLAPLLVLAGLEAGLRLGGYGYPAGFFLRRVINGRDAVTENRKFGWRFFDPAMARAPRPTVLPAVKSAETYRIFVLGESAAFGDPQPDFGLPRVLEALLSERYPGTHFEVVNAAMTAINSNVLLPIARDCARQHGDLWVIYMGNNEVVGPFGAGTVFGPQAPSLALIRGSLALKATRTGELLAAVSRRLAGRRTSEADWGGMAMFLNHQVRQDDPRMARVYAHFSRNLDDILEVGREHGVKMVVSTVVSNLKDCAPFASLHRPDLTAAQTAEWNRLYQAGVEAEQAGKTAEAAGFFQQAARSDERFADLQFRWGRCCLALGRDAEARQHFVLARDDDALRFRADSRINEIIRQAASGRERDGILFVDAQEALARQSPHGLPGGEWLYEHVHLNFDGNYRLARCLADEIVKELPETVTRRTEARPTWPTPADCARRLAWTGWNRYEAAASVMLRVNDPPFTSQLDHAQQYQRLQEQMEELRPALTPAALRQSAAEYRRALAAAPADWVLHKNLGRLLQKQGDLSGAEECWRQVTQLLPQDGEAAVQLGLVLTQLGRADDAIGQFETALRLAPDSVPARNGLGLALARKGEYREAIRAYERALTAMPDSSESHLNLGMALNALGETEAARQHFRRALDRKFNNAEALVTLGKMCVSQGWVSEALTNFTDALRLDPTEAAAHFCLGGALASLGRRREAQQHYAEAVWLNPDYAEARLGLGIELGRQGKDAEALEQFAAAVRLNPALLEARLNLGIALMNQQRNEEALSQLREVLRLAPDQPVARKYFQALQAGQAGKP